MEENKDMALNQANGEETVVNTTPVVEEQTAEETSNESQEVAPQAEEVVEETDQKKGAQNRIRELAGEVKSLKERLSQATSESEYPFTPPKPIDLSEEVTPEQYRQHVMQQADALVQLRLKQSEALSRIAQESSEVEKIYPQLDKDSDQFDKELSETISDAIEAQLKVNPYSTSVKKVAEKLMKPYLRSISNGVAKEKETIAKQVSESALRPTSVRQPEKTAETMSIAELEAKLGIVQS